MLSYFIRHNFNSAVSDETMDYLWQNNCIAIHFANKTSLNKEDYPPKAKSAIETFKILNDNGGYIWAEYQKGKRVKVGKIKVASFSNTKGQQYKRCFKNARN